MLQDGSCPLEPLDTKRKGPISCLSTERQMCYLQSIPTLSRQKSKDSYQYRGERGSPNCLHGPRAALGWNDPIHTVNLSLVNYGVAHRSRNAPLRSAPERGVKVNPPIASGPTMGH